MELDQHSVDSRLVALCDLENARRADTKWHLRLAVELDARTILDLGCGTGVLTHELVSDGRRVVGIDPASAMLARGGRRGHCPGAHGRPYRAGVGRRDGWAGGEDQPGARVHRPTRVRRPWWRCC